MVDGTPAHKDSPGSHRQFSNVKSVFNMPVGSGCGLHPVGGCGRVLTAGHAVNIIVYYDGGEVNVPPRCMDKVVATDGSGITITHNHNNFKLRLCQLDPSSESEGSPVSGV